MIDSLLVDVSLGRGKITFQWLDGRRSLELFAPISRGVASAL